MSGSIFTWCNALMLLLLPTLTHTHTSSLRCALTFPFVAVFANVPIHTFHIFCALKTKLTVLCVYLRPEGIRKMYKPPPGYSHNTSPNFPPSHHFKTMTVLYSNQNKHWPVWSVKAGK